MVWITRGFKLAGAVNIFGILLFSKGLTNTYLSQLDPQVFSTFGQGAIILWGLAYLAVAGCHREAKWVVGVFVVEKLVYVGAWIVWMAHHATELPTIFAASPLTGIFMATYGVNDLLFAGFFSWVFFRAFRTAPRSGIEGPAR